MSGEHLHRTGTHILLADGPHVDAFGRLRVSNPQTIFDSKLLAANDSPLLWDEALESGANITATTPTAAKPYIDLVSTGGAGVFTRQTKQRFNYQPGKSQQCVFTGVLNLTGGGTGVTTRIGLFDDNNGAFFECKDGIIRAVIRSNETGTPVDTPKPQSEWNVDRMNGSGGDDPNNENPVAVDWTKAQVFVIDFQWLSVGRVRFGVHLADQLVIGHEAFHANNQTTPWCSTPNLPIRYQIENTSAAPASSMRCICSAIVSEGGQNPIGIPYSFSSAAVVNANSTGTKYALVGVRLAAAHLGCEVDPLSIAIVASSANDLFEWQLIFNPTVGGTFTYAANLTNSCTEQARGGAGNPSLETVTGGHIIAGGYGATQQQVSIDLQSLLKLGADIDGTRSTFALVVIPITANIDVRGTIN